MNIGRLRGTDTSAGFTLLEVLVALAIVALGLTAVFLQAGQAASVTASQRDKVLAGWVGTNRFNELALEPQRPAIGETTGIVEFGGRQWRWRVRVSTTTVEGLRRVDVDVALAGAPERVIHTVSGFLGPVQRPESQSRWAPAEQIPEARP